MQVKFHLSAAELSPEDRVHKAGQREADENVGLASADLSSRQFSWYQGWPGSALIVLEKLKFTWQQPSPEYVVNHGWNFFYRSSSARSYFSWCGRICLPYGEKAPTALWQLGRTGWLSFPSERFKEDSVSLPSHRDTSGGISLLIILHAIEIFFVYFFSKRIFFSSRILSFSPKGGISVRAIKDTALVRKLVAQLPVTLAHPGMKPKAHANHCGYL